MHSKSVAKVGHFKMSYEVFEGQEVWFGGGVFENDLYGGFEERFGQEGSGGLAVEVRFQQGLVYK